MTATKKLDVQQLPGKAKTFADLEQKFGKSVNGADETSQGRGKNPV